VSQEKVQRSALYRQGIQLAQEIEALESFHKEITDDKRPKRIMGTITHYRPNGVKVHIPRAVVLRVLTAEIAEKKGYLAEVDKKLR
jgi:hypothetical protein